MKRLLDKKDENDNLTKKNKSDLEDGLVFSKPWQNSDALLIVEGKELHVHTLILSIASPVFERMFNGSFKEAETKRVILEGKSYEMVENMMRQIYPVEPVEICITCYFLSFHSNSHLFVFHNYTLFL